MKVKSLIKAEEGFSFLLEKVLVLFMVGVAILEMVQVFLRYVLHLPMQSIEEVLVIPAIWLYFLGAVYASKREEHINARILEIFMKKKIGVAILRAVAAAASVVVTSWLGIWGYDLVKYSLRVHKVSTILKYPMSVIETALFICLIPMFLYSVVELVKYVGIIRQEMKGEGE